MKKQMMPPFKGKESKSEEGKEKRMSPAAYKRGEMLEKGNGYKAGGFKPCAGCKTAAKCAKAGKCMGKK